MTTSRSTQAAVRSSGGDLRPGIGAFHRWLKRASATIESIAIRGQLGCSVGHRDDRFPERFI